MSPDEMKRGLALAAQVFTHHDRYGRTSVRPGMADVFAILADDGAEDVVVRIDGGYSMSREDVDGVVAHWADHVQALTGFLRSHWDEIHQV